MVNPQHNQFLKKVFYLFCVLTATAILMIAVGHWSEHGWVLIPISIYLILVSIYQVYWVKQRKKDTPVNKKIVVQLLGWLVFAVITGFLVYYADQWSKLRWIYVSITGMLLFGVFCLNCCRRIK